MSSKRRTAARKQQKKAAEPAIVPTFDAPIMMPTPEQYDPMNTVFTSQDPDDLLDHLRNSANHANDDLEVDIDLTSITPFMPELPIGVAPKDDSGDDSRSSEDDTGSESSSSSEEEAPPPPKPVAKTPAKPPLPNLTGKTIAETVANVNAHKAAGGKLPNLKAQWKREDKKVTDAIWAAAGGPVVSRAKPAGTSVVGNFKKPQDDTGAKAKVVAQEPKARAAKDDLDDSDDAAPKVVPLPKKPAPPRKAAPAKAASSATSDDPQPPTKKRVIEKAPNAPVPDMPEDKDPKGKRVRPGKIDLDALMTPEDCSTQLALFERYPPWLERVKRFASFGDRKITMGRAGKGTGSSSTNKNDTIMTVKCHKLDEAFNMSPIARMTAKDLAGMCPPGGRFRHLGGPGAFFGFEFKETLMPMQYFRKPPRNASIEELETSKCVLGQLHAAVCQFGKRRKEAKRCKMVSVLLDDKILIKDARLPPQPKLNYLVNHEAAQLHRPTPLVRETIDAVLAPFRVVLEDAGFDISVFSAATLLYVPLGTKGGLPNIICNRPFLGIFFGDPHDSDNNHNFGYGLSNKTPHASKDSFQDSNFQSLEYEPLLGSGRTFKPLFLNAFPFFDNQSWAPLCSSTPALSTTSPLFALLLSKP